MEQAQALTVEQLIEELQKIDNKQLKVYYQRDSWSIEEITGVYKSQKESESDILFVG